MHKTENITFNNPLKTMVNLNYN